MADISLIFEVLGEETIDQAAKRTQSLERDVSRLSKTFQKTNMTNRQYVKGLSEIAKKHATANATVRDNFRLMDRYARNLKKADSAIDQVTASTTQADAAQKRLNASMKLGGNQFARYDNAAQKSAQTFKRRFNTGLQQAGYQVGDFFVQIQGGQSAMVALGQQGSQLAGIFGPGGAVFGAVLAIGTAIATMWWQTSKATSEFKTLEEAADSLRTALEGVRTESENVTFTGAITNTRELTRAVDSLVKKLEDDLGGGGKLRQFFDNVVRGLDLFDLVSNESISTKRMSKLFGVDPDKFGKQFGQDFMDSIIEAIENEDTVVLQSELDGLTKHLEAINAKITEGGQDFLKSIQDVIFLIQGVEEGTLEFVAQLIKAVEQGEKIEGLELEGGIKAAADAAKLLADNLNISLLDAKRLVAIGQGGLSTTARSPDQAVTYGRAVARRLAKKKKDNKPTTKGATKVDPLKKLREQIKLENLLLLETSARQRVIKSLGDDYENYTDKAIAGVVAEVEALEAAEAQLKRHEDIVKSVEGGFSDFFNSLVDGTKSVEDAFKDMARNILASLWDVLVTQQIVNSLSGAITGFVGGIPGASPTLSNGGVLSNGTLTAFANGGVVNGPTLFPMANGMGLMGEAGPEAVMPLTRGKDGKLGVQSQGGGDTVVVNQYFNFSANGDESVKRIIAQAAPQISKMTQKDILKSRRSGGQMKAAFG